MVTVPTPVRQLQADLIHDDPPQVQVTWQKPLEIHGTLKGYTLWWGRKGETYKRLNFHYGRYSYISDVLGMLLFKK